MKNEQYLELGFSIMLAVLAIALTITTAIMHIWHWAIGGLVMSILLGLLVKADYDEIKK